MLGILRSRGRGRRRRGFAEPGSHFNVLDPGSSTLRALTVEAIEGKSVVWGWAEEGCVPRSIPDINELTGACEESLARAEEMARARADRWFLPDHLVVGLPASELQGRAWSVDQRRARPEHPIEERELVGLLGRTLRLVVNRLQGEAPPAPSAAGAEWVLVEAVPVALTVDGRRVTDPVGFRGKEIGATVFAALSRLEVIEAWQRVAADLEFSTLILTAAPLALAAVPSGPQGILVDIGGATTDLTWWQYGCPVAFDSLSAGGGVLTQALVRKWGLSPDKAERLKRAYASGRLDEGARSEMLEVMSPLLRAWLAEAEAALVRLSESWEESLPERLYLLGGASALPGMAEAIGALAWSERLHFARYPQVGRLRPTDVPGVVNRTDLGRGAGDIAALALAAWAARESRPLDRPARILNEFCQA
jgi:cell division protein FtsA